MSKARSQIHTSSHTKGFRHHQTEFRKYSKVPQRPRVDTDTPCGYVLVAIRQEKTKRFCSTYEWMFPQALIAIRSLMSFEIANCNYLISETAKTVWETSLKQSADGQPGHGRNRILFVATRTKTANKANCETNQTEQKNNKMDNWIRRRAATMTTATVTLRNSLFQASKDVVYFLQNILSFPRMRSLDSGVLILESWNSLKSFLRLWQLWFRQTRAGYHDHASGCNMTQSFQSCILDDALDVVTLLKAHDIIRFRPAAGGLKSSWLLLSEHLTWFTMVSFCQTSLVRDCTPVSGVRSLRDWQLACRYACPHLRRSGQRECPCKVQHASDCFSIARPVIVSKEWEGSAGQ